MSEKIPTPAKETLARTEKKGLVRQQETVLAGVARDFLNQGKTEEALALIKKSNESSAANLVTLIGIWISNPEKYGNEADSLFNEFLATKHNDSNSLMDVLRFVKNPKRNFLPTHFAVALETRMRELRPGWDGKNDLEEEPEAEGKALQETDPNFYLQLAGISNPEDRTRYLHRYIELGGSRRNVKYLKMRLHRKMSYEEGGMRYIGRVIRRLREEIPFSEFRKWAKSNFKGKSRKVRRSILANYIVSGLEKLDQSDWQFIAEGALKINDGRLQKICFDYLKGTQRSEKIQSTFDALANGVSDKPEISPRTDSSVMNPIYEEFPLRNPVNKQAALAVSLWSQDVLKEE